MPEQASLKSGISESTAAEAVATEIERARRHSNKVLRKEVELKELRYVNYYASSSTSKYAIFKVCQYRQLT
jgi:hypothetical protein